MSRDSLARDVGVCLASCRTPFHGATAKWVEALNVAGLLAATMMMNGSVVSLRPNKMCKRTSFALFDSPVDSEGIEQHVRFVLFTYAYAEEGPQADARLESIYRCMSSTHPLLLLHFVAELSPRVRLAAQRHVAWEGTLLLLHHADLEEADEGDDLEEPKSGDLRQRGKAVRHIGEREVRGGREHAGQAEVLLDEVASDGQHRNASVLDLNVPEAVEPGRNRRDKYSVKGSDADFSVQKVAIRYWLSDNQQRIDPVARVESGCGLAP